ncbi:MAG: hypothetical protein KF749_07905 [Bacteroidetes bacterium]|nr:hypothetical protein [Bacteroidota bacterium]MCW5894932.1 hypothetical protein [Bacteroidota bacterium]
MKPVIRLAAVLSIVLGPSTLGIATSPIVPWQHYVVHGTVQRAPGLSKENFTCTLAGKLGTGAYQRLRGGIRPVSIPVAITDSSGRFSISVSDGTKYDSLVVMVVLPDRDPEFGEPFSVATASVIPQYIATDYTDPSGCSACRATGKTTVIDGYVYNLPEQTVVLPF